jgi:hypothetical protein
MPNPPAEGPGLSDQQDSSWSKQSPGGDERNEPEAHMNETKAPHPPVQALTPDLAPAGPQHVAGGDAAVTRCCSICGTDFVSAQKSTNNMLAEVPERT